MRKIYRLKRTPLKRSTKPLRRTPLKRRPWRRTEAQARYHDEHPNCEVCGQPAMPTPHHINHIHQDDRKENFFSLCYKHHVGGKNCPHSGDELTFIVQNRLDKHPKWKQVYEKITAKKKYNEEMERLIKEQERSQKEFWQTEKEER